MAKVRSRLPKFPPYPIYPPSGPSSSGGGGTWGSITGDINDQTDLIALFGAVTTPDATETVKGKAEIATQGEVDTGSDDTGFVTPLKLKTNLDANQVTGTVGDGSTQEPVITHNLGTKSIHVSFWLTASPFTNVDVEFERTDTNTITLKVIGTPLTSGEISYFISRR